MLRRRTRHRHADPARLRSRLAAALLPALLAGLALAACGNEESEDDVVVAPQDLIPSRSDYASQVDGLCAFYESRVEELGRKRFGLNAKDFDVLPSGEIVFKPGRRPPPAQIEDFVLGTAVPNLRAQLEEIRDLTPPRGDQQRVDSIYDTADEAINGLEADPQAFVDDAAIRGLFSDLRREGRRYGLRECGL